VGEEEDEEEEDKWLILEQVPTTSHLVKTGFEKIVRRNEKIGIKVRFHHHIFATNLKTNSLSKLP
jgi:hypothetical protein